MMRLFLFYFYLLYFIFYFFTLITPHRWADDVECQFLEFSRSYFPQCPRYCSSEQREQHNNKTKQSPLTTTQVLIYSQWSSYFHTISPLSSLPLPSINLFESSRTTVSINPFLICFVSPKRMLFAPFIYTGVYIYRRSSAANEENRENLLPDGLYSRYIDSGHETQNRTEQRLQQLALFMFFSNEFLASQLFFKNYNRTLRTKERSRGMVRKSNESLQVLILSRDTAKK